MMFVRDAAGVSEAAVLAIVDAANRRPCVCWTLWAIFFLTGALCKPLDCVVVIRNSTNLRYDRSTWNHQQKIVVFGSTYNRSTCTKIYT